MIKSDSKIGKILNEALTVLLGSAIGSFAIVAIMIPSGLTFGGVTGLSRIIQQFTSINYSLIYYGLAMIVLIIVWVSLGFKEARKIIAMSFTYPIVMFIFEKLDLQLLQTQDIFLSAVFCGVAFGISNGITFLGGYSSGGTDSLAKVIKYKFFPYIALSKLSFIIDVFIVIASAFVFGINIALYALIIMYINMKMTDAVLYGVSGKIVELNIITTIPEELSKYVMSEVGRGVTSLDIVGEYTGETKKELKIICSPRESFLIKRFLAKNDPQSFVSVFSVNSVWGTGKGFSDIRDIEN